MPVLLVMKIDFRNVYFSVDLNEEKS
jgi:hypothetical protein